jgi:glycine/D-amino acid oxidase-like deaminating enzyme
VTIASFSAGIPSVDLLIVGGGILGMSVAYLAAQEDRSRRILVCRMSDSREPFADTLRNQSWLQSGLRYVRALQKKGFDQHGAVAFARRMRASGRELHEKLGLPVPSGFGIVRLVDTQDERNFVAEARLMGVPTRRLTVNDSSLLVGQLYEPGGIYYTTPEVVFDEARIMEELRHKFAGQVMELPQPISLQRGASHVVEVVVNGAVVPAPTTVLTAGAGSMPLMKSLGFSGRIEATQTPLAVIPAPLLPHSPVAPQARVFVDRVHRFSAVSHAPSARFPQGASVLGAGYPQSFQFVPADQRRVPQVDWDDLWANLPPVLQAYRGQSRCTAGVEVGAVGRADVLPYVDVMLPGLIVALPGRATLAMRVASDVVQRLPAPTTSVALSTGGVYWSDAIHMHHEDHYTHLHNV